QAAHQSAESSYISECSPDSVMKESDDEGRWTTKVAKKQRHRSNSSEATIITQPTHNLVVIAKPTAPTTIITNMNPPALKQMLENLAPDGVIQIRPKYLLNLLAIDAKNIESTKSLLQLKKLGTIQVRTYEPAPPSSNVGVIRGVSTEIADADLWASIREKAPVVQVRRLGKTEAVKLVFSTRTSPEYVFVGHTRYGVLSTLKNRGSVLSVTASDIWRAHAPKRNTAADVAVIMSSVTTLILGDFNAHNEAWGDKQTSTRGRSLEDITAAIGLRCPNDGTTTFVTPGVEHSVLDLSFAKAAVPALWLAEPDSWGTWRMARILAGHAVRRSPVLGLVNAQNITLPQAAELLADEFTPAPAPPPGFVAASATSTPTQVASNSDFTLGDYSDQDHLLWTCPTLADKRKSFLDGLRQAGVASATTQVILFLPGSARDVSGTFAALLKFLEDTGLFDRL
ncbi:hypothetical protein HPB47_026948, partial [Ixodes persulcatus]